VPVSYLWNLRQQNQVVMGLDSIEDDQGVYNDPQIAAISHYKGWSLHTTGGPVPGRFPPNQTLRIYGIDVLKAVLDGGMLTLPGYCLTQTGLSSLPPKIPPWDLRTGQAIRNGFGQKEGLEFMNMVPSESSSNLESIHTFRECLDAAISDYLILKWTPASWETHRIQCQLLLVSYPVIRYFVTCVLSQWCYLSVYPF